MDTGEPQVVALCGSAGLGKSRLCHEFLSVAKSTGVAAFSAAPTGYGMVPYAAISRALREILDTLTDQPDATLHSKLREATSSLGMETDHIAGLANILDLDIEDDSWAALDPPQRRFKSFDAMRWLCATLAGQQPTVFVFEDAHWFDSESLAFLDSLVLDPPANSLILITYRPEFDHAWTGLREIESVTLANLSSDSRHELIAALLGDAPDLSTLRTRLAEKTDGNPFFIEETIRFLVDNGTLLGDVGAYRLAREEADIELAPSIESVIAARIDSLQPMVRDLLHAAAAIGDTVTDEELRSVIGIDAGTFGDRLEPAIKSGMLIWSDSAHSELTFAHATISEVAYHTLLKSQRRELHGRIMRVLETIYHDRKKEQSDRLADQALRGELWPEAIRYYTIACSRATSRWANVEALLALDQGLRALDHLPPNPEWTAAGIDLRLKGLAALLPLGERDRMVRFLREAEYMAISIHDDARLGAVRSQLAIAFWIAAEHDLAMQAAQSALQLAQTNNSFGLEKAALYNIATVHHARAEFDDVIRIHKELVSVFSGDLAANRFGWPGYPSVFCRTFLGSAHTLRGELDAGLSALYEGMQIADELDHPYSRTIVREELAYTLLWAGQHDKARAILEDALGICVDFDVHTMYPAVCGRLAIVWSQHQERLDYAIELSEDALARETYKRAGRYAHNFLLLGLGTAYLRAGAVAEALEMASRVAAMTDAANEHAHHASALALIGDVHFSAKALDEAAQFYIDALSVADRCNILPMTARCNASLARVYAGKGDHDNSQAMAKRSNELFSQLGIAGGTDPMIYAGL